MSKYVNEIIDDILKNPTNWKRLGKDGLQRSDVKITGLKNGALWLGFWFTSVAEIEVNGVSTGWLSWWDKLRIEEVYKHWLRNASISML